MPMDSLCPLYIKWLKHHPEHARVHRTQAVHDAHEHLISGKVEDAYHAQRKATDIALAILYTPFNPSDKQLLIEDLTAFGMMAIQVAKYLAGFDEFQQALFLLQQYRDTLLALLPLFAGNEMLVSVIADIEQTMEIGMEYYQDRLDTLSTAAYAIH